MTPEVKLKTLWAETTRIWARVSSLCTPDRKVTTPVRAATTLSHLLSHPKENPQRLNYMAQAIKKLRRVSSYGLHLQKLQESQRNPFLKK
jgi:hypothetical protein